MGMPVITHSNTPRAQAISDVIESVALEQAALAHILNAEGEKLQKVVSLTTLHTDRLFEANRSVERMLNAVVRLEIVLQSKLDLFNDCLCDCPRWPHSPCDDGQCENA